MRNFSDKEAVEIIVELIKTSAIRLPSFGNKYPDENLAPSVTERNKDLAQTQATYLKELYDSLTASESEES